MAKRITQRPMEIAEQVLRLASWDAGSLRGAPGARTATGMLPPDWARTYRARHDVIGYTITSYGTPIAWFDNDACMWVIPKERYSKTTSRHQNIVKKTIYKYVWSGEIREQ